MQLQGRRFRPQRCRQLRSEIERYLHGGAGTEADDGAANHGDDWPVLMAAQDAHDVWRPFDELDKALTALSQANPVHGRDAAVERRVVQGNDRRCGAVLGQALFEPVQPLLAQRAVGGTFLQRVQADQPQRAQRCRELAKGRGRRIVSLPKPKRPQIFAPVMIARDQADGHRQRCQQPLQMAVGFGFTSIDQVAGDDQKIWPWLQIIQPGDRLFQGAGRIPAVPKQVALIDDV